MSDQIDDEDFDLNELPDDELVEQVYDDLYNGLRDEVAEATRILLARGWSASRVLDEALVEGMRIVGVDFRDGILFVPEVLMAANAMKGGMELLRPLLAETGAETIGKIVIGTVKGDIHDIGKNLVSMMMEGAAFGAHHGSIRLQESGGYADCAVEQAAGIVAQVNDQALKRAFVFFHQGLRGFVERGDGALLELADADVAIARLKQVVAHAFHFDDGTGDFDYDGFGGVFA